MERSRKVKVTLVALLAVCLFAIGPSRAFADGTDFERIKKGMDNAADTFATTLPFYSTLGLNTPDAYIGQLMRVPPNVTLGLHTGAAFIPVGELEDFLDEFGVDVPSALDRFGAPLPAALVDARFGGIVLPFDFGVKLGFLPEIDVPGTDASLDYLLVGADVRTPIFSGRGPIPTVSVGAGVNYVSGSLSFPIDDVTVIDGGNGGQDVTLEDAVFSADWQATVFDLKLQASSNLLILTPYAGLGASYALTDTDLAVESDDAEDLADASGLDIDDNSISVSADETGWSVRAFGGTSINMALLRLDLGLSYNFLGNNFGANIGARIQL